MTRTVMFGLAAAACLLATGSPANAQALFFDDFEGDLSLWVGKGGGGHSGVIVEDPQRSGNHVLTFTGRTGAGDVFSSEVTVTQGQTHVLSFEYLGLPNGGVPGNLGGAIGFAEDTPSRHRWLAATVFCCGVEDDPLIDDGQWRTYAIAFDVFASGLPGQFSDFSTVPPSGDTIRLMLEDFVGAGGVAGDIFFDNVRLDRPGISGIDVPLDIKPQSCPNPLNVKSNGVLPVAILGTADFDLTQIELTTIRLRGVSPIRCAVDDVATPFGGTFEGNCTDCTTDGADGFFDLVLLFSTQDVVLSLGNVQDGECRVVTLTGELLDGTPFSGEDVVTILKRGK